MDDVSAPRKASMPLSRQVGQPTASRVRLTRNSLRVPGVYLFIPVAVRRNSSIWSAVARAPTPRQQLEHVGPCDPYQHEHRGFRGLVDQLGVKVY